MTSPATMLRISSGGTNRPFRCHCGCNVFQPLDLEGYYDCNACGERYKGERTPAQGARA